MWKWIIACMEVGMWNWVNGRGGGGVSMIKLVCVDGGWYVEMDNCVYGGWYVEMGKW